jgi:hypothetical protein
VKITRIETKAPHIPLHAVAPGGTASALEFTKQQRSHVLFVLSDAKPGYESTYLKWHRAVYREKVFRTDCVLGAQHYERHEVDITQGQYPPLPFRYLSLCELAVDGAQAAEAAIDHILAAHRQEASAQLPATWLYYPASEKVGRAPAKQPSLLTIAFANAMPGQEAEFREWYATRHIRHALNIPALVSGQCFERTQFQKPGALPATFNTIALYEQEGTPESIIQSFAALPESTFDFPMLDIGPARFAEWVYRPA